MNDMTIASAIGRPAGTSPAPALQKERHFTLDVLRGFALLGILLANIDVFGTPEARHAIPVGMAIPAFEGPQATLDFVIVVLKWIVVEGKMRGLFSMLFGAGVLLLTERIAQRSNDGMAADIYTRRNFWLLMLGLLHAIFL